MDGCCRALLFLDSSPSVLVEEMLALLLLLLLLLYSCYNVVRQPIDSVTLPDTTDAVMVWSPVPCLAVWLCGWGSAHCHIHPYTNTHARTHTAVRFILRGRWLGFSKDMMSLANYLTAHLRCDLYPTAGWSKSNDSIAQTPRYSSVMR